MTDGKLYTSLSANTIMAKLTYHVQRINFITSSTNKYYSLSSEDDFRSGRRTSATNNISFQNYPHPDDHPIQTTDASGFKPFTKTKEVAHEPLDECTSDVFSTFWLLLRSITERTPARQHEIHLFYILTKKMAMTSSRRLSCSRS